MGGHMATYDAVVTLMNDLEILVTSLHNQDIGLSKEERETLYKQVCLMDSLLRNPLSRESYDPGLVSQFGDRIVQVARETQYHVDYTNKLCFSEIDISRYGRSSYPENTFSDRARLHRTNCNFEKTLQQIAQKISSIEKTGLEKTEQNVDNSTIGNKILADYKRSYSSPNKDAKFVGLEGEFVDKLDFLTGQQSHLKVLTLTGMAGIGKTTFTRDYMMILLYVHAWVTLSQQYELKRVLLGLLSCIKNPSDEIHERSHDELAAQLYRSLKGQRYIIVLDDMWDSKAWDDLRRALPDDKNGSRIILTSRLKDVCIHVSPDIQPHSLRCLTQDESWELLCSKIFPNESCPMELVQTGKQIADKCQGLPLAIVAVGGLLLEMDKTSVTWGEVAKCVGSLAMENHQHCLNILALSYNHLTDPLKACFLYTCIFPEDNEIPCKKLVYLWMGEGFISPRRETSLEEVAEIYLEDLIARSLIMVKRRSSNGRVKICYIHYLMREFCMREAQKNNFLHVIEVGKGIGRT